jgi:hypothetical protein
MVCDRVGRCPIWQYHIVIFLIKEKINNQLKRGNMPEFDIDKCTENFNIRIPLITKQYIDRLPQNLKTKLKDLILHDIEIIIHESFYTPGKYLKSGDDDCL